MFEATVSWWVSDTVGFSSIRVQQFTRFGGLFYCDLSHPRHSLFHIGRTCTEVLILLGWNATHVDYSIAGPSLLFYIR